MDKTATVRWASMGLLAAVILAALCVVPAGAELYDEVFKPVYTIKFKKGTFAPLNEDEIHEAALWVKGEEKMLQVEGYSCADDGVGDGRPTHRVDMADKRAVTVMNMLIGYGVPQDKVFTVSYEYGNCVAVITAL
ncbi:MAG: hypothetical protein OEV92_03055 [Nitrospinota bacterium]|nr:hypothetical protein [Nitrospinota bacterium]